MQEKKKLSIFQIITIAGLIGLVLISFYVPEFGAYMDATPELKWPMVLIVIPIILVKTFPGIANLNMWNDTLTTYERYSDGSKPHTRYAVSNVLIDTFVDMKPKMQRDCPVCAAKVVEGKVPVECTLAKGCARGKLNGDD